MQKPEITIIWGSYPQYSYRHMLRSAKYKFIIQQKTVHPRSLIHFSNESLQFMTIKPLLQLCNCLASWSQMLLSHLQTAVHNSNGIKSSPGFLWVQYLAGQMKTQPQQFYSSKILIFLTLCLENNAAARPKKNTLKLQVNCHLGVLTSKFCFPYSSIAFSSGYPQLPYSKGVNTVVGTLI